MQGTRENNMAVEYKKLGTLDMPDKRINEYTQEQAIDHWGEELRYNQLELVLHAMADGTVAREMAAGQHELVIDYVIHEGKDEGAYSLMQLSMDTRDEELGLEVIRIPGEANPYRQATIDDALDCIDTIVGTPLGGKALAHMKSNHAATPDGIVTAPPNVRAEIAAYLAAHGIKSK